jgi:hypothetical protein
MAVPPVSPRTLGLPKTVESKALRRSWRRPMPASGLPDRRELLISLALASAIVLLRSVIPLAFEVFDPDQAVYGLMTKHLSEFRAFPLFFYGQNYMLGVESWIAVPFFWIGGPTVTMQRLPLVLVNLCVAFGYLWVFVQQGLRPYYALVAALPVIAFAPSISTDLMAALGVGVEPFAYALILWQIRDRPLAYGAVLCFGTLHREFTFLALPALALVEIGQRSFWSVASLVKRGAAFAAVWLVVDILKRNINMFGPSGGAWASGSLMLGPQTFVKWLSFDWNDYAARLREVVTSGIPDMLGLRTYDVSTYVASGPIEAGFRIAAIGFGAAVAVAILRVPWLVGSVAIRPRHEGLRFCVYLALIAVQNVLLYGLNKGILIGAPGVLRYVIFAPLLPMALFAAHFMVERSRRWAAAAATAVAVWAGGNVVDNARLIRQFVDTPPPRNHRIVADHLTVHGIRYARARYWDAYVVSFLSREQVIVASTETVRISSYQVAVDRHSSEAVTLQRLPCDTGIKVAAWCVVKPPGQ